MAVSIIWPLSLPQKVQKGFTESSGVTIIRTPVDYGPAKMRRRGKKPSTMDVSFLMTTAQVSTFENFVNNSIYGTYRFGFPHPRLGTQVEVRLVPSGDSQLYTLGYAAPGYWNVSFQLEIMP